MRLSIALGAGAALLASLAIACGDDDGGEREVDASLEEWSVTVSTSSVEAGQIKFTVSNQGEEPHEFLIIRSDLAPAQLPTDDDGKVPEDDIDLIDEIEPFAAGSTEEITVDLDAGSYVLICNIVEFEEEEPESHYLNGMYTGFTVE